MNKHAYFMGYIYKAAFTEGSGGPVWTGYTANTPAGNTKEGDKIENEGTPYGIKDYEGGGSASATVGLPKGANMDWPAKPVGISPHSVNDPIERKLTKVFNAMPKNDKLHITQGAEKPADNSQPPEYAAKGGEGNAK